MDVGSAKKEIERLELIELIKQLEGKIDQGITDKNYYLLMVEIKNQLDAKDSGLIDRIKKNYPQEFEAKRLADEEAKRIAEEKEAQRLAAEQEAQKLAAEKAGSAENNAMAGGTPMVRGGPPPMVRGRGGPPLPLQPGRQPPPLQPGRGLASQSNISPLDEIVGEFGKLKLELREIQVRLESKKTDDIPQIIEGLEALAPKLIPPKQGAARKKWAQNAESAIVLLNIQCGLDLKNTFQQYEEDIKNTVQELKDAIALPVEDPEREGKIKGANDNFKKLSDAYAKTVAEKETALIDNITKNSSNNDALTKVYFDAKDDTFSKKLDLILGAPNSLDKELDKPIKEVIPAKEKDLSVQLAVTIPKLKANELAINLLLKSQQKFMSHTDKEDLLKNALKEDATPDDINALKKILPVTIQIKLKSLISQRSGLYTSIKEDEATLSSAVVDAKSRLSHFVKDDGSVDLLTIFSENPNVRKTASDARNNKNRATKPQKIVKKVEENKPELVIPEGAKTLQSAILTTTSEFHKEHFFNLYSAKNDDREMIISTNLETFLAKPDSGAYVPATLLTEVNLLLEESKGPAKKSAIPNILLLAIASGYIENKPGVPFDTFSRVFKIAEPMSTESIFKLLDSNVSPIREKLHVLIEDSSNELSTPLREKLKVGFSAIEKYQEKSSVIQYIENGFSKVGELNEENINKRLKSKTPSLTETQIQEIHTLLKDQYLKEVELNKKISAAGSEDEKNRLRTEYGQEIKDIMTNYRANQKNEVTKLIDAEIQPVLQSLDPASEEDLFARSFLQDGNMVVSEDPQTLAFFHQLASELCAQTERPVPSPDELTQSLAYVLKNYEVLFSVKNKTPEGEKTEVGTFSKLFDSEMQKMKDRKVVESPETREAKRLKAIEDEKAAQKAAKEKAAEVVVLEEKSEQAEAEAAKVVENAHQALDALSKGPVLITPQKSLAENSTKSLAEAVDLSQGLSINESLEKIESLDLSKVDVRTSIQLLEKTKATLEQSVTVAKAKVKLWEENRDRNTLSFMQTGGTTHLQKATKEKETAQNNVARIDSKINSLELRGLAESGKLQGNDQLIAAKSAKKIIALQETIDTERLEKEISLAIDDLAKVTAKKIASGTPALDAIKEMISTRNEKDYDFDKLKTQFASHVSLIKPQNAQTRNALKIVQNPEQFNIELKKSRLTL